MDSFWIGFWQLPLWFKVLYLGIAQFGILFVLWELAHRKMHISKEGVTFDRLSTRRGLLWQLINSRKKDRGKIPIESLKKG